MSSLQFFVRGVQVDEVDNLISLNLIYQIAGSPKDGDPRRWTRSVQAQGLIERVTSDLNVQKTDILKTQRGRGSGGTWAHWKLALAYAAYLDPKLYSEILETYKQVKSGDIEIAKEVVDRNLNPEDLESLSRHLKEHRQYLDTYHGVHNQLKEHEANQEIQHAAYNKHVNQLANVEKGSRGVLSREQKLKMILAQGAGELQLMDSDSKGWVAVTEAKNAGTRVINALKPGE